MTPEEIIESFNNAWRGLCRQYDDYPEEHMKIALNLLSKIISKVEAQLNEEKKKDKQISLDEWIAWFKESCDE